MPSSSSSPTGRAASPERAIELLGELSELAKAVEDELDEARSARRRAMHSPDELKALVDEALERLELWPELHGQATSVRYALEVGGKRVRPVIALAVGEALGAPVEQVMPAALAIELVHTFSLVHDDLPAMDDDEERRGHPSTWKKFGEGVGVLAGDALLGGGRSGSPRATSRRRSRASSPRRRSG